jgi:hypothetical protein
MRSRHPDPIYSQENLVVLNKSFVSTKNDELKFLKGNIEEIILAKDSNNNFFAEAFTPLLPLDLLRFALVHFGLLSLLDSRVI